MTLHDRFNPTNDPSPIQVWMDRMDLARLFGTLGFREGAEIGVFVAEYSQVLLEAIPGLHLRCVDSWAWSRQGVMGRWNTYWASKRHNAQRPKTVHAINYERACARLAPYPGAEIMRMFSHEAAALIPDGSLDFVYVDAQHTKDGCLSDLELWSPKVRRGGIVSGDDYRYRSTRGKPLQFGGVDLAVDEFVARHGLELFYTSETERTIQGVRHSPGQFYSFFWEKP